MRGIIICGGSVGEYIRDYINFGDFVICADSGYDRAKENGITPDIVIGDMDSTAYTDIPVEKRVFPKRKDFTDSELAVMYADEKNFDEVLMFGMIGTRMDHTLANISLLSRLKNAVIIDSNNEIYFAEREFTLCGNPGDTVSVIPCGRDVSGVTLEGLDYPLQNATVKWGTSLGVSNVMKENECRIKIEKGSAFIIRSRD